MEALYLVQMVVAAAAAAFQAAAVVLHVRLLVAAAAAAAKVVAVVLVDMAQVQEAQVEAVDQETQIHLAVVLVLHQLAVVLV